MATDYKTPGVYVEEIPTLAPSVAPVATAIPVFIGYTEKGPVLTPTRIDTMLDYVNLFGYAKPSAFTVGAYNSITQTKDDDSNKFLMYYGLSLYFQNGGGSCYILSVGNYSKTPAVADFQDALKVLKKEDEPTLIVLVDAVSTLQAVDYYTLCNTALLQCKDLGDRFLIVDIPGGDTKGFRDKIGINNLCYAAAYYPYLQTTLNYQYEETAITVSSSSILKNTSSFSFSTGDTGITVSYTGTESTPTVVITDDATTATEFSITAGSLAIKIISKSKLTAADLVTSWDSWKGNNSDTAKEFEVIKKGDGSAIVAKTPQTPLTSSTTTQTSGTLSDLKTSNTAQYNQIKTALANQRVTLPPSCAIAGIYASVDRDRGVWKAPANVSLNAVIAPVSKISDTEQDSLNIDPTAGKSINAIRSFTGKGTLVWGARTLAGNDNEWRYISVRRLFITIEESTRKASSFAVFEPNDATTWLKVKAMIESYLYGLWQQGALAGSKPESAYFVSVGLGKTMTAQDILEGKMIVSIGVAAVRPAEFIILRFSHKMQEA
ncbi:MAG: phage tail sheath C-terminal domain-containing protein [Methylococcaceae bacterium]